MAKIKRIPKNKIIYLFISPFPTMSKIKKVPKKKKRTTVNIFEKKFFFYFFLFFYYFFSF